MYQKHAPRDMGNRQHGKSSLIGLPDFLIKPECCAILCADFFCYEVMLILRLEMPPIYRGEGAIKSLTNFNASNTHDPHNTSCFDG